MSHRDKYDLWGDGYDQKLAWMKQQAREKKMRSLTQHSLQAQLAAQQQWYGGITSSGTTNVTAASSPNVGYPAQIGSPAPTPKPDGPIDWLRKRVDEITTFAFSEVRV